eukprot:12991988-Alexandrium_andersonii.AAC.1
MSPRTSPGQRGSACAASARHACSGAKLHTSACRRPSCTRLCQQPGASCSASLAMTPLQPEYFSLYIIILLHGLPLSTPPVRVSPVGS